MFITLTIIYFLLCVVDVYSFFYCKFVNLTAYPAVYGQFPQAIPQPIAAVAPAQREGKHCLIISDARATNRSHINAKRIKHNSCNQNQT